MDGTNTYVYGLDLVSATDGSGNQTYFTYDGLGSTTDLTDGAGTVTDTYSYDVFGAVRASTGSSANAWQFTGEQKDADSGFQYLRARYYDPANGRFLTRDPFPGFAHLPGSQNPYAYVMGNPVNYVDPYGYFGLKDIKNAAGDFGGAVVGTATGIYVSGKQVTLAVGPYAAQCGIWGASAAVVTANPYAAAAGCAAGAGAKLWSDFVSDDPLSQCLIAGVGGAAAGWAVGANALGVGGATCLGGALSWLNGNKGPGSSKTECVVWAGVGLLASAFDKTPDLLAAGKSGLAGCIAGAASNSSNSWFMPVHDPSAVSPKE